jgi:hypothetical protein
MSRLSILAISDHDSDPRKTTVRIVTPEDTVPPPKRQEQVQTICASMKHLPARTRLNLLIEDDQMWQTRKTPCRLKTLDFNGTISLDDVYCGPTILSAKAKITLAIVLANSVLQLYGSPWLPKGWDRKKFRFLRSKDQIMLRPLLAADFRCIALVEPSPTDTLHKSPERLELGVLLLELFLQDTMENLRDPAEDLGCDEEVTADTQFFTASRVHEQHNWDVYERYSNAVAACLECNSDSDGVDMGDRSYRQFLYDKVIGPLEDELSEQYNISPEEFDDWMLKCTLSSFQATKKLHDIGHDMQPTKSGSTGANTKRFAVSNPTPTTSSAPCKTQSQPYAVKASIIAPGFPPAIDDISSSSLARTEATSPSTVPKPEAMTVGQALLRRSNACLKRPSSRCQAKLCSSPTDITLTDSYMTIIDPINSFVPLLNGFLLFDEHASSSDAYGPSPLQYDAILFC